AIQRPSHPHYPAHATLPNSDMPSTDEWNLRDQVAGAIVFQNVVHPKAHGLSATSPSSKMWALLYAKFMRTSEALKGLAIDKLRSVKLTDTRYLPEHLDTLTTLRGEALSIGANCSDLEFMPIILASL
ncbi:hypothetical protein R3P38DRAFT_2360664, partial [Favolaschia claudopus]